MGKLTAKFAGVTLQGNSPIVWRIQTGTQPFLTTWQVDKDDWWKLEGLLGSESELVVEYPNGTRDVVRKITLMHQVPSESRQRVSFVVADRRWKWAYSLVVRDYNIPKKSGDVSFFREGVPTELGITTEQVRYRANSLNGGRMWTAKEAVEDVLRAVMFADDESRDFRIESFPIQGDGEEGQMSLQDVLLRDSGDSALARILSYVPGAEVYIDTEGEAVVFDGADLSATRQFVDDLPPALREGEYGTDIDRRGIRPKRIHVHFQRTLEAVFQFDDDFNPTQSTGDLRRPYVDNVIPTTDIATTFTEYDSLAERNVTKENAPPGVWAEFSAWLDAKQTEYAGTSPYPWTFETIRRYFYMGDLDGCLGAGSLDLDDDASIAMGVAAIKEHFRRTFRISRRWMEQIRAVLPRRVGLLDPYWGTYAKSAAWGRYYSVPTTKGMRMLSRIDPDAAKLGRNIDALARFDNGERMVETTPGPWEVAVLDSDLGILQLQGIAAPIGTVEKLLPCFVVDERNETPTAPSFDLVRMETAPMGFGIKFQGGSNGIFLARTARQRMLVSIVPAAPNDVRQFHRETIEFEDIAENLVAEYGIESGEGPDLHVFVNPNEADARFAWYDDATAEQTLKRVLGIDDANLESPDPTSFEVEGPDLDGYLFVNRQEMVIPVAESIAAELWISFADSWQGNRVSMPGAGNLKLVGNMDSAGFGIAAAPSGKALYTHSFPGRQRPINRWSLAPAVTRKWTLRIIGDE